ncbi:hypothetical protein llap_21128 [Limosa lapponica baueri]|uniref:Uncharacterized protein n=1 Tax=Limosa lapponica baueri TaxID=1758121 RepID=A0A2I0T459_LIMLA|nr:hypothetical protein llap_21128 [Limosa lapponica baueri]
MMYFLDKSRQEKAIAVATRLDKNMRDKNVKIGPGRKGPPKGHLVRPPRSQQGHPQVDQVAQGLVKLQLEYLKGRGLNHLPLVLARGSEVESVVAWPYFLPAENRDSGRGYLSPQVGRSSFWEILKYAESVG